MPTEGLKPEDYFFNTITGKKIYPLRPRDCINKINLYDISVALAHTNRFGGHTMEPYSVAAHSVHAANLAISNHMFSPNRDDIALAALFHDAAEAYLGDVITPVKRLLPNYERLEKEWLEVIFEKFNISNDYWEEVHKIDALVLDREANHLQPLNDWADKDRGVEGVEVGRETDDVRNDFMNLYHILISRIDERKDFT